MVMVMEKRAARTLTRSPNLRSPWIDATAAAAVEQAGGGSFCSEQASGIRVKIVISKEELRQLMEALSSSSPSTPAAVEELLRGGSLRRRCMKVSECSGLKEGRWRPELRSIPEEQY
ncbi:hypothetical protein KSP40_PGU021551 [Platanthera guangdongensis]|uniref:Uncharacterized protein n=1 Tax=Platanthera guangdongensis TaxID=2320717 RepID=A0ABR2LNM6_9ASPA